MAQLSIIVPIYNVEKYLAKCIESILKQTYGDFELILINDGSPDNCHEIMEHYAKLDSRIVAINQQNKGVSAARNTGLKNATGKYISFVDPDDYIDLNFYFELIRDLEKNNADIACCNWDCFFEDGSYKSHNVEGIPHIMGQKEFVRHIFDSPRTLAGSNCNKVFLKEKIIDYYDEQLTICEDNMFLLQYCKNISKGCYINKALYHILERSESAMRKKPEKIVSGLRVREKLIDISNAIHFELGKVAEKDFLDSCYLYMCQFSNIKQPKQEMKNYIKKNWIGVLSNNEIYWKTKLVYFLKCL